jgi:hypothetical protein
LAKVEQPQNCFPALAPRLAARKIREHDSDISVEIALGKGTRFIVSRTFARP